MATAAAATLEQWHCQNCDLSRYLAVITFNLWPCQRRTRIEKIEVQTHDILGVPYQANPALWICTIFVSVPLWSSMYCVCMYMHYLGHVHVNRHLRFSPLLAATNVTSCDVMWLPCLMISGSSINACKRQVCRARSTLEFTNVRWVSPSGSKRLVLPCWKPRWPESNSCSSQFLLVVFFLWLSLKIFQNATNRDI